MKKIRIKKADAENIKPFGKIVNFPPTGSPAAEGPGFKFWPDIANYTIEGDTEIGLCTVYKEEENIVTGVEKHDETPEILIPIDAPVILPVLVEGKNSNEMEAFEVKPGEAVIINEGIWHAACIPVGKSESTYFVIFKHKTPDSDVYKKEIDSIIIE